MTCVEGEVNGSSVKETMNEEGDFGSYLVDSPEKNNHTSSKRKHRLNKAVSSNEKLSGKYFDDTIPEDKIRSLLPSNVAEEYLLFIKHCNVRKRKTLNVEKGSTNQEERWTGEHKENLPLLQKDSGNNDKSEEAKKEIPRKRRSPPTRTLLKCLLCSVDFKTKAAKQAHHKDHLTSRGYECTHCSKAFDKMPALVSHVSRVHLIDKKLSCKVCGKKFKREWLLRSHSLTHTSGRKFACPVCKRGFTRQRDYFEHLSGHVGFNTYKCEECGKRFQKSCYLSLHRRIHVSVRPFKCKSCEIQCFSYSAAEIHFLMHTENLGFECAECNVRIPSHLKALHYLSHTKKKNFECTVCPARFHAKSTLQKHLQAHLAIKEFNCDVCYIKMKTTEECLNHVCPKWESCKKNEVTYCSVCKIYLRKHDVEKHKNMCDKKRSKEITVQCENVEDDPCGDEDDCCGIADNESYRTEKERLLSAREDDDAYSSGYSDYLSSDSDLEEIPDVQSDDRLVQGNDPLDLDWGLVHHMRKAENDAEEEDDDN